MAEQVPSVGRVVHYVAHGSPNGEHPAGAHRAAIIAEVYATPTREDHDKVSTNVGLCVLNPSGFYFLWHAPYDPTGQQPGSWHWPEFVPPQKGEGA